MPACRIPGAHGPKTPCRTPIFLGFGPARRDCAPDGPRQPAVLRAEHARVRAPIFNMNAAHVERQFRAGQRQPAPEPGRGGFRMGRTQPHGIAGHHGPAAAPIFNATPGYVERMFRARRAKAAQPAPRGWPSRFAPNCGEGRDFGGYVRRSFEGLLLGS